MTYDADSFSGSIADTNSETLTVDIATRTPGEADYVYVTLDDGTVDTEPAQYTITVRKHTVELGGSSRTQFILDETGRTDRSWRFEAIGARMDIEIENTSGGSATYEIEAESRVAGGEA